MSHNSQPTHPHTNSQEDSATSPVYNLIADLHSPSKHSGFTRRRFLQGVSASVAGVTLVGCGDDDNGRTPFSDDKHTTIDDDNIAIEFLHGIASGDPLNDRVILWTRVTPKRAGKIIVNWEIATDLTMNNIVNRGQVTTSSKDDYTVKVDAEGLEANSVYYYRFSVGDTHSDIGRTKTLPTGNVSKVKLAVFSCSNYPAGYFHAYADAAKQDDVDVAVHLGDYIYEYGRYAEINENNGKKINGEPAKDANGNPITAYASAHAKQLEREVNPATELISAKHYRTRYAQYKTDPDLQALHAAMPMIAVWDDHEVANDSYNHGAENHQEKDGKWNERKMAAMTAFHEWLPTRNERVNEIYRSFNFGDLLSLHMLDTRIIGRDKQLNYNDYLVKTATGAGLNGKKFTEDMSNPNRQLLGMAQQNWLTQQMNASKATWQMLGQQVIMARMSIPSPILLNFTNAKLGVDLPTYVTIAQKAKLAPTTLTTEEKAILAQPAIPYNLDAWDGYIMARENVLGIARALNKNLVVLSGDTHNAWASNLTDFNGKSVGVEFATSSVSSPGFEEYLPNIPPATIAQVLPSLINSGTLKFMDASQRGYMLITVTPEKCQSEWVFVSDILKPEYTAKVEKTLSVNVGKNVLS